MAAAKEWSHRRIAMFAGPVILGFLLCGNSVLSQSVTNDEVTKVACGWQGVKPAEVTSPTTIKSPQYPNNTYMLEENCHWRVTAPKGQVVELTFSVFDLEPVYECYFAYVKVHDGDHMDDSNYIAQYCGQRVPNATYTSTHNMYIQFVSLDQGDGQGFVADVKFVDLNSIACSAEHPAVITWDQGGFVSPDWPNKYPPNAVCSWRLDNTKDLRLEFVDWELRAPDEEGECLEYVALYDGSTTASPELGRYCGYHIPVLSGKTANSMLVLFNSKELYTVYPGQFHAKFLTVNLTEEACYNHKNVKIDWTPGFLNGPLTESSDCEWVLTAPEGMVIRFEIVWFDLPDCSNCGCAKVSIYNGDFFHEQDLIGHYCRDGWKEPYIQSGGNTAGVKYYSYKLSPQTGFSIKYSFFDFSVQACSESRPIVLTHDYGIIASPDFNLGNYPNDAHCEWAVQTEVGKVIEIHFMTFELEPCPPVCDCDVLELYNGPEAIPERQVREACDDYRPLSFMTSLPGVFFKFLTDEAVTFKGFKAEYWIRVVSDIACGSMQPAVLSMSPGDILSPNYGNGDYPFLQRCKWQITTVHEKIIQLTFLDFELEYDIPSRCLFDKLTVYDGETTNAPKLGTYCGSEVPRHLYSTQRALTIEFSSNDAIGAPGFHLAFDSIEPIPVRNNAVIIVPVVIIGSVLIAGTILCLYYKKPQYFKCPKKQRDTRPRISLSSLDRPRPQPAQSSQSDQTDARPSSRSQQRSTRSRTSRPYRDLNFREVSARTLSGLPTFEESNAQQLIRPPSYKDLATYQTPGRRIQNVPPPTYLESLGHTLVQIDNQVYDLTETSFESEGVQSANLVNDIEAYNQDGNLNSTFHSSTHTLDHSLNETTRGTAVDHNSTVGETTNNVSRVEDQATNASGSSGVPMASSSSGLQARKSRLAKLQRQSSNEAIPGSSGYSSSTSGLTMAQKSYSMGQLDMSSLHAESPGPSSFVALRKPRKEQHSSNKRLSKSFDNVFAAKNTGLKVFTIPDNFTGNEPRQKQSASTQRRRTKSETNSEAALERQRSTADVSIVDGQLESSV